MSHLLCDTLVSKRGYSDQVSRSQLPVFPPVFYQESYSCLNGSVIPRVGGLGRFLRTSGAKPVLSLACSHGACSAIVLVLQIHTLFEKITTSILEAASVVFHCPVLPWPKLGIESCFRRFWH